MQLDWALIRDKAPMIAISALLFLFLVSLPRYDDIAKIWYVLLILLGLVYLLLNMRQIRQTTTAERLFLLAVVVNFCWIALCFYLNGEPGRGASFLWGRHFYFLFLIPLYFLFRKIQVSDSVILLTLLVSAAVALGDIVIDLMQDIDHRLQGMNPNAFGPLQLCLSWTLLFFCLYRTGLRQKSWAFIGLVMALLTVGLSMSRNTWLSALLTTTIFFFYLARPIPLAKRVLLVTVLLALCSSLYLVPSVKHRINDGIGSISSYFTESNRHGTAQLGTFGIRAELWKAAWQVFLDKPLIGAGLGGVVPMARANAERYRTHEVVYRYKYMHNQYLTALATRGFPGLVLLLLVLGIPLYIAMQHKSVRRENEVARLSIVAMLLVYALGNFFEDHFEGKSATMFVSVMLPLWLARLSIDRSRAETHAG